MEVRYKGGSLTNWYEYRSIMRTPGTRLLDRRPVRSTDKFLLSQDKKRTTSAENPDRDTLAYFHNDTPGFGRLLTILIFTDYSRALD